jgi:threonine/homoserine/homoserine lactone efflux protein
VALPLVLGVGVGDLIAASLALLGAGALLAASASAFTIVKWIGAGYLVWLGIRLLRTEPDDLTVRSNAAGRSGRSAFRDGFLVTVFNPKGILFFVAFVPQFIRPDLNYASQATVFVVLFTVLAVLNGTVYAVAAAALRRVIRSLTVVRWMNRIGGVVIAGAGVAALFTRRPVP